MLKVFTVYGIVERNEINQRRTAYFIDSSSLVWTSPDSARSADFNEVRPHSSLGNLTPREFV